MIKSDDFYTIFSFFKVFFVAIQNLFSKTKTKKRNLVFDFLVTGWCNEMNKKKDPKANDYEKLVNLRNDLHSYWQRRKWINQGCRNRYNLINCRHKFIYFLKKGAYLIKFVERFSSFLKSLSDLPKSETSVLFFPKLQLLLGLSIRLDLFLCIASEWMIDAIKTIRKKSQCSVVFILIIKKDFSMSFLKFIIRLMNACFDILKVLSKVIPTITR